jgi:cell division septum initiation protein DivIVA
MPVAERLTLELQRRIFGISVPDLRELVAAVRNELADMRVEVNRLHMEVKSLREEVERGRDRGAAIEDMTLDQVLALHAGCREALERFEIHGAGSRTLREAAKEVDAELDTIVATIKNLMKDRAA